MKTLERGDIVALTGAGTETAGIVLVQQFRMINASARLAALLD